MTTQAGFILKVLVISAALSILIKYGGPYLSIPATPALVLMVVFLPTLIMAVSFWQRSRQYRQLD
ncbi:hypothetical protein [Coleofasciculus sp. H7-2]|uniref:hypothetical protein n=1 Tax=Coleofasciculus sp. H7-2 TaxID=3351545 RepID=UPI00366E252D